MKKQYLIIILSVLAIVIAFCLFNSKQVKYVTKPVTQETITEYVEASGTIKPINTIAVGTQVSGTVAKIYVDYNSVVKKGDMLAELDPSLFQSNVDQSTAKLNNARASLSRATASLNYKKNNYQRYKNLYAKNYVSKDEVELAYSNYQQALAEVSSATAEVNAAQATLKNNMTNLGYSKITSPVDGTVISRAVDVGQTVAASFNTPTLFEVAKDLTQMQIETSVSEADIGKIKVGQVAKYTLDGYQDRTFEGKVTQVRLASTTTNNVVTYTVIVSVDNSEGLVIPGMTANVSIVVNDVKNALCVPNQALKFSPADNTQKYEKQGVWIKTNPGLKRFDVDLGAFDDNKTQIITKEVNVGDKVCVGTLGGKKTKKSTGMRPPRI